MNIAILRFICVLQFILAAFMVAISFVDIFEYRGWYSMISFGAFALIIWWTTFILQLIQKNYPDEPVAGAQKATFNWLYLINFFILPFILGRIINNVTTLYHIRQEQSGVVSFYFYGVTAACLTIAIFQAIMLYGAFKLRRKLNDNFARKIDNMDLMKA
ncbi:MAG: hypothetical protein KIT80_18990 [Chitinophagaceae bacterium]|nr:hypothetical protein [Chitinophagaceae bacterium]MCW5929013.1 hypothetical protein [Chitinophagaceae bacterium]